MGLDAARDDKVARARPAKTGLAEAGQAQLLGIANAHGHLDGDALTVGHAALAFALRTRVVDGFARAVALAARGGRLHVAQERVLHGDHAALAAALGAGHFLAVFAQARAVAIRARRQAVVDDFLFGARGNFLKRQTQANAHVAAFRALLARTTAARGTAEEAAEDIADAEAAAEQVVEVDVAVATIAAARGAWDGAEAVVLGALVGVAEHIISFVELFELVFRVGSFVYVRVQLARFATKRLLDIRLGCVARDAENFVQVLRHGVSVLPFFGARYAAGPLYHLVIA